MSEDWIGRRRQGFVLKSEMRISIQDHSKKRYLLEYEERHCEQCVSDDDTFCYTYEGQTKSQMLKKSREIR